MLSFFLLQYFSPKFGG